MVWLTRTLFVRMPVKKVHTDKWLGEHHLSTDRFWRKRQTLMNTAQFRGRKRNCFAIASRYLLHCMQKVTEGRELFRRDFRSLCEHRIEAAAYEHGYNAYNIRDNLSRTNILLNRKILANLAIWEPRTFRSISAICARKENQVYEEEGVGKPQLGPGVQIISRNKF